MRTFCIDCTDRFSEICPIRPTNEKAKEVVKLAGEVVIGVAVAPGEAIYSAGPMKAFKPVSERLQSFHTDSQRVKDCIQRHSSAGPKAS